jgi:hypothetical protein
MNPFSTFISDFRPFLYIRFHDVNITESMFEEYKENYLKELLVCKKNKEKIILIIDVNEFAGLPLQYMVKQKEFNKQIFHLNEKYLESVFIYCKNKMMKQMIQMNMMIEKTAAPLYICRSVEKLNRNIEKYTQKTFDCQQILEKYSYLDKQTEDS